MQTQDMLSEADNFALVTCNEQNRLPSLIWTRGISPRKVLILGSFNPFSRVYRQFDVQFELRTSNTRPIKTRAFSRFLLFGRGSHGTIRVDTITLGANDHHGHLEGSYCYPGTLTLPQNSIESLRGDVRSDLCQSVENSLKSHPSSPYRPVFSRVPSRVKLLQTGLLLPSGSIQRKTAQTRPINGPTRLLTVPSRIPGLGMTIPDL
ncbi:hypothetical protein CRG98_023848 [Punica granatum]|uniref:Uncharacterized protein n=1 Tax=Punica granatum TaxID=22663 RepID=A0A2I0JHN2_PUNGR|nr:hypothetical protein CRG98_023848 [Punica granatum]